MPRFDSPLHNDVVALICAAPSFTPHGWRMWLLPCLDADTLSNITWQGSPREFASNLAVRLTHDQLVAALDGLRPDGGVEWMARSQRITDAVALRPFTASVAGR
jgi:hypothetical protein